MRLNAKKNKGVLFTGGQKNCPRLSSRTDKSFKSLTGVRDTTTTKKKSLGAGVRLFVVDAVLHLPVKNHQSININV